MELKVGDAMTRGVIYANPQDNVQRVAEIMKKNDIDSVIIMENEKGIGIVTDTDIIAKLVAKGKDPRTTQVSEIMSSPLVTVTAEDDIDAATRKMVDEHVKRLVVILNKKIIGIISEFDIVRIEPALHTLIQEHSRWDLANVGLEAGTLSGICEICGNYSENLTNVEGRLVCDECTRDEY